MMRERESEHKTERCEFARAGFGLPAEREVDEQRDKERVERVRFRRARIVPKRARERERYCRKDCCAARARQFVRGKIERGNCQRGGERGEQIEPIRRVAYRHEMLKQPAKNQVERIAGRMNKAKIPRGELQLAAIRIHHIRRERAEVERETGEGECERNQFIGVARNVFHQLVLRIINTLPNQIVTPSIEISLPICSALPSS